MHAVIRLDGPDGSGDPPPSWGTAELLVDAVRASAGRVLVRTPYSRAVGDLTLRWGAQLDARPLHADGDGPGNDAVAAYVAKYVTKGASETGVGIDHKVSTWDDIETAPVTQHVRTLMRTAWRLGGLPEFEPLHLRTWTHTLGYRGHVLTKSRAYSTTYAALRAERGQHVGRVETAGTVTERQWRYVGSGHTPGASLIAAGVAEDLAESRRLGSDARHQGARVDDTPAQV